MDSNNPKMSVSLDVQLDQKTKIIFEPTASTTSLPFLVDEFEDEKDRMEEPILELDTVEKQVMNYQVQRSIHFLLIADPSATVTQLNALYDCGLDTQFIQIVLTRYGGIEIIINLLEVKEYRCHLGALRVIEKLASNNKMRMYITNLGIIPLLIEHLKVPYIKRSILVAKALTQLCKIQKAARFFRKFGGLPYLIECLDVDDSLLNSNTELLTPEQKDILELATAATETLKMLVQYPKTAEVLRRCGFLLVVKKITDSCHRSLLVEMFELLSKCAPNVAYRKFIEYNGLLVTILQNVLEGDTRQRTASAITIAECARDSELTCHIIRMLRGINKFVDLISDTRQPPEALAALTFAAAKLAQDNRNLKIMTERGLVHNLMRFLRMETRDSTILSNVLEGLAECGRLEDNRTAIANAGLISAVVRKLMGDDARLLTAAAMCLGTCARTPEVAEIILKCDGMRMLMSVLHNTDTPSVPATALWALRPLIKNTKESAEELRSMMGGFTVLTNLLNTRDYDILGNACCLMAEIMQDEENLRILSDCGLVRALSECTQIKDEEMCVSIAEAIAYAATLRSNAREFGLLGVVPIVRNYLASKNVVLHLHAMRALAALTLDPFNCVILHECDGVAAVLCDVSAPWTQLQSLATIVLKNMRMAALTTNDRAVHDCRYDVFAELKPKPAKEDKFASKAFERSTKHYYQAATRRLTRKVNPLLI